MQIQSLTGICWGAAFIVDRRSKTKTVEKFGKDSPTVFIYRFSRIPASSYPRWSIKRSSENVSKSIECSNARSMDTRQSLKAFYASIRYGIPVVHSSLQQCKLYVLFNWQREITDFLEIRKLLEWNSGTLSFLPRIWRSYWINVLKSRTMSHIWTINRYIITRRIKIELLNNVIRNNRN